MKRNRKLRLTVREMVDQQKDSLGMFVVAGKKGLDRIITSTELNRPGLALTGYYTYFAKHRIQMLGKVELSYLKSLSSETQTARLLELMQMRIPAFIVGRNLQPTRELLSLGEEYNVPIIRTPYVTMSVVNNLSAWLEEQFAPSTQVHGVLMEVHGVGVLIMGKSGVGKSECALSLVERGHILVADDVVPLKVNENNLTGYANPKLGHHMEIRGIGIVNVQSLYGVKSVRMWKHVDFIVTLEPWKDGHNYDRLGLDEEVTDILGLEIPNVVIPVKPGRDVALLIETAAQNIKLRSYGFNAAQEFNDHLISSMQLDLKTIKK